MRNIKSITKADKVNMGGIMIDQPLPNATANQIDPFLLIHHWSSILQGDQHQREVGVGPHPHRGFSPVTIILKGELHHRDSLGNDSIVSAGGVQWMNAGKGITHSERPSKKLAENGGHFEIIQFWVNTPSEFKMLPAKYLPQQKNEIPVYSPDDKVEMQVLTGEYKGVKGPIPNQSPMLVSRLDMKSDGEFELTIPAQQHTLIYQLDGSMQINDKETGAKSMTVFENEEGAITLKAKDDTRMLLLSGSPIGEPIESYGPFVMNNTTEIMEAMRDAQMGKMGVLIEEF
ncbi:pirin family protein [bacterium]|nr:pirin family protein [bacterium]